MPAKTRADQTVRAEKAQKRGYQRKGKKTKPQAPTKIPRAARQKNLYSLRPNNRNNNATRSVNSSRLSSKHSVINNMLKRQNMNGHISPIIQFAQRRQTPPTHRYE
ncbi:hypothetical protein [Paraburkholderia terrae]